MQSMPLNFLVIVKDPFEIAENIMKHPKFTSTVKFFLHSCGDNTLTFDYFIKWGIDGCHAFENTSTVDKLTIIGGVGVDYLLTEESKREEVIEKVKEVIFNLSPGGRFILAPVHSSPIVDMSKEKIMVELTHQY